MDDALEDSNPDSRLSACGVLTIVRQDRPPECGRLSDHIQKKHPDDSLPKTIEQAAFTAYLQQATGRLDEHVAEAALVFPCHVEALPAVLLHPEQSVFPSANQARAPGCVVPNCEPRTSSPAVHMCACAELQVDSQSSFACLYP